MKIEFDEKFQSINERIRNWSQTRSDRLAFAFLERGEKLSHSLTFGELHKRALQIANELSKRQLIGQPVVLLYPPGLDFIEAFCACLYSGVIAVPAPFPTSSRAAERCVNQCKAAGAKIILTVKDVVENVGLLSALYAGEPDLLLFSTDLMNENLDIDIPIFKPTPDSPAFLQFTSGSTGQPKGVAVSHRNLITNQEMIAESFGHDDTTCFVSWLPLFHDMGLVGTVLHPLYLGVASHIMSPHAFLQKPARWLQAISHYRATTSGAPNFAFELCHKVITKEQLAMVDLSSWRVAFCGSEPVRAATLTRFADAFEPFGFRRTSLFPCYGMAEATLFIAGGPVDTGLRTVEVDRNLDGSTGGVVSLHDIETVSNDQRYATVTSCGKGSGNQRIVIVDPISRIQQADGRTGEIWIAGPHVCKGYWREPEATEITFNASMDPIDGRHYLKTGDLGFLWQGELFVTGRSKDVLIVRGVKHHPEDIEATIASCHHVLVGQTSAIISVDDGSQSRVIVLQELPRHRLPSSELPELSAQISSTINRVHGFRPDEVVMLRAGSLPRTTSGKLVRSQIRVDFLAGRIARSHLKANHDAGS